MITLRQFSPGETIIREHESGETAFIIEKGRVEVFKDEGGRSVSIACLEKGATFGEMSLVDDMPRSATIIAREETLVREIHRDDLHSSLKENPDAVFQLLKNLFERLREANAQITRLTSEAAASASSVPAAAARSNPAPAASAPAVSAPAAPPLRDATKGPAAYLLEGLTPRARDTLSGGTLTIKAFPFKIGRKSSDPLVGNHLAIDDEAPLQISRHHVSIIREGDRLGVVDRGSQLGAGVDETRIGGHHDPGPVFFRNGEGTLVLGRESSLYRYRIRPAP